MPAPLPACGSQNNLSPTSTSHPSLLFSTTTPLPGLALSAPPTATTSAGRPHPPLPASTLAVRPPVLISKPPLSTSKSRPGASIGDESVPSASSPRDHRRTTRPQLRTLDPHMTTTLPARAVLHKRGSSGSSSPFSSQTQFATPFATYEEPDTDFPAIISPKIKPYLRKMSASAAKEDQGYVDLSKSVTENERLSGLGIQDFGARAMTDSALLHHTRGQDRTTSVGSQISAAQPFTHPMKQTPRPYNTAPGVAYASSVADEDDADEEHADVVNDDFQPGAPFRSRRSMSISSMATTSYPTPLSQSYTANDLDYPTTTSAPRLLGLSHSNLSVISNHSTKSKIPARRISTDLSPSIRSSFDQAFSFSPRLPRVSTDSESLAPAPSREERIRAARRKFEEKEASKDRKAARTREAKLAKRTPRTSGSRARSSISGSGSGSGGSPLKKPVLLRSVDGTPSDTENRDTSEEGRDRRVGNLRRTLEKEKESEKEKRSDKKGRKAESEKLQSRSYASTRPTHPAAMPRHVLSIGHSEEKGQTRVHASHGVEGTETGSWLRFSTWLQTRMLSCGGGRD